MLDSKSSSNKKAYYQKLAALSLGALGVVYGDIGTSPLYALRECFNSQHSIPINEFNLLGVLSLIVWSLFIVVTFKYLFVVMYADNQGEGGIMALMALAFPNPKEKHNSSMMFLSLLGLFGAALLYGDGVITPAITVLSATEGLATLNPTLSTYSVSLTILILIILFGVQRYGTARIGFIFGPIMLLWFLVLAILGVHQLVQNPSVLRALNPFWAVDFVVNNPRMAFIALASVFLVATGAEALYADMGHFGRRPIKLAWLFMALPALLLNYFGQGALLLRDFSLVHDPFFQMAPRYLLIPLVALATLAAVIASQALISGVFSLTQQAVQLGFSPRLRLLHTSQSEIGQIYIPAINWSLMVVTIMTVLMFKSSSALAGAYGIAVAMTMVITTLLAAIVAHRIWKLSKSLILFSTIFFLIFDLLFLASNGVKIMHGGWFPLTMGAIIFILLSTWKKGRRILAIRMRERLMPFEKFIDLVQENKELKIVKGTAVFMNGDPSSTPPALIRNVKHNHILHERIVSLSIVSEKVPTIAPSKRVEITKVKNNVFKVKGHFGFNEQPNIHSVINACKAQGYEFNLDEISFFIGKETIIATGRRIGMSVWREKLFSVMAQNAQNATSYFGLPPDQVVEIGAQVEI
ncbi:MAG: potassium transporter Kup [Proteobacteria bacterium]|nr:potassium transporter Kup [Pseudomonadota bacterium]